MKILFLLVIFSAQLYSQNIRGFVTDSESKELLVGVNIYCKESNKSEVTNKYGFYSISFDTKSDSITLMFSMVGYKSVSKVIASKAEELNVSLNLESTKLEDIVIRADDKKISETARMSTNTIPIKQILELPALLGEKDILKTLQLLPGFQRGNDGNGLIFVRGGAADQNLLLLDEAPVYNLFHAGGFFSIFNGNAIKRFDAIKGAFPARYGGRLSSVIDVTTRDGNKENLNGSVGVGILSGNILLEGPLQKGKSSFLFSGRMSYWDKLYSAFRPKESENISFGLYDYIAKLNFELSPRDKLYVSNYFGRDNFKWLQNKPQYFTNQTRFQKQFDFGFNWGNNTATVRWNRVLSQKMFINTTLIYSHYNFVYQNDILSSDIKTKEDDLEETRYQASIRDYGIKMDIDYYANKHHFIFGAGSTIHQFVPEETKIFQELSGIKKDTSINIQANEHFLYVEDEWHPAQNLLINLGMRASFYEVENKSYKFLEPRIGSAFLFGKGWALKAGYARMNQYVHLASNNGVGFPFDVWIPSTAKIIPQQSDQFSGGLTKDLINQGIEFSAEIFYKKLNNLPALKEGSAFLSGNSLDIFKASLIAETETWEDKVVQGKGRSHGFEALIQKKTGKTSGWLSYTYSKVINQFEDLNRGKEFFPRFDRRHNVSLVTIYKLKSNVTFSGTWVYASGQRLTVPESNFIAINPNIWYNTANMQGNVIYEYGEYGNFKTPDYHRLDLNVQFYKKKTKNKIRTWEIGVFNIYNRKNPFFYSFSETQPVKFKRVNIFPIIPSISYTIKF